MNSKMSEELKIPKERVAVLIGEKGSTKRKIQKLTNTKIFVSSKDGDVTIEGEDNYRIFVTGNIIKAIRRGFNPDVALKLLKEDYAFDMISINEFSGKSKKQEERIKSRAIGTDGKARKTLEKMTNTNLCIYGKTIGIIGSLEDVYLAKRALDKLLQGSPHTKVYKFIEREKEKQESL